MSADPLARNRKYWDRILDPQNLSKSSVPPASLRNELPHWDTTEQRWAVRRLQPLPDRRVLDLGGGLGVGALALAQRGARVVLVDLSRKRADAARRAVIHERVADRVDVVVAAAERLPFRGGAFHRVTTKSVLIHTDLEGTARELRRVLRPGGRAVLLEPLDAHPVIWLYRTLLAPRAWKHITRYFNRQRVGVFVRAFGGEDRTGPAVPGPRRRVYRSSGANAEREGTPAVRMRFFHLLGVASAFFAYGRYRSRRMRCFVEAVLDPLDAWLFRRAPGLRWRAWFLGIEITRGPSPPAQRE